MTTPVVTVDLNKRCAECGKGGAVGNGLCLSCTTKALQRRPMKSAVGQAVQRKIITGIMKPR